MIAACQKLLCALGNIDLVILDILNCDIGCYCGV